MTSQVLLQMWGPFRQSLIAGQLFYVEQARRRLLSQFDDIGAEADKAAEQWLKQRSQRFDPDRDDPGSIYEAAYDVNIEFYQLLSDMREQTRLAVIAGMFHEWEKKLRDWLVREVQHWHRGGKVISKIWSVDFVGITDLLECFGWTIRAEDYFSKLDACRLVVNVYKHGGGKSLEDLKRCYPEYLDDAFFEPGIHSSATSFLDFTNLKVSDDQLQTFSDAIVLFWEGVPENTFDSQVIALPSWFEKAVVDDRGDQLRANNK